MGTQTLGVSKSRRPLPLSFKALCERRVIASASPLSQRRWKPQRPRTNGIELEAGRQDPCVNPCVNPWLWFSQLLGSQVNSKSPRAEAKNSTLLLAWPVSTLAFRQNSFEVMIPTRPELEPVQRVSIISPDWPTVAASLVDQSPLGPCWAS